MVRKPKPQADETGARREPHQQRERGHTDETALLAFMLTPDASNDASPNADLKVANYSITRHRQPN